CWERHSSRFRGKRLSADRGVGRLWGGEWERVDPGRGAGRDRIGLLSKGNNRPSQLFVPTGRSRSVRDEARPLGASRGGATGASGGSCKRGSGSVGCGEGSRSSQPGEVPCSS